MFSFSGLFIFFMIHHILRIFALKKEKNDESEIVPVIPRVMTDEAREWKVKYEMAEKENKKLVFELDAKIQTLTLEAASQETEHNKAMQFLRADYNKLEQKYDKLEQKLVAAKAQIADYQSQNECPPEWKEYKKMAEDSAVKNQELQTENSRLRAKLRKKTSKPKPKTIPPPLKTAPKSPNQMDDVMDKFLNF